MCSDVCVAMRCMRMKVILCGWAGGETDASGLRKRQCVAGAGTGGDTGLVPVLQSMKGIVRGSSGAGLLRGGCEWRLGVDGNVKEY